MTHRPRPLVLCILDGWGHREDAPDNAITRAKTPVYSKYWAACPHALLEASEQHVGLPGGQFGNSEVGHMNLGAGRVVYQDLPMIDRVIEKGDLEYVPALQEFIARLEKTGGTCHLMGLVSPGGVHAHQRHIVELARIAGKSVPVAVHAFLDGRDTPPQSAAGFVAELERDIGDTHGARLATLCGRYYAMDRDKRWERVERAYDLLVSGEGAHAENAAGAVKASYAAEITDEFVLPVALNGYAGMKDGDGFLFANFRADRAREIATALCDPSFDGFARKKTVRFAAAAGMIEYSENLNQFMTALFPPKQIDKGLGEVVADAGLTQLRIAETEKYPHVTFFFNGGREHRFPGEERILVPSPKVATYDLRPEMSARAVTDEVVQAIEADAFDLIVLNYANPDMVGHTGVFEAAVEAVEAIDECLGRLFAAVEKRGGAVLLTADHGNCERMREDGTNGPHTAHTISRVPVMIVNMPGVKALNDGKLADVAPTVLELMQIEKPGVMTGDSLVVWK
ncbi:MAG: 2,3-bisphosphoglycerate-independent phosphoglycerate mutase [Alphaproteobacteria bacterium]|nr:2,3-bisphosphoglycerate-independent phosphoglycerate mutase [Alphaproteobacteria bacterium]